MMVTTLTRYSYIINTQARALLSSNTLGLTDTQRKALRTLHLHTQRLETTVEALVTLPDAEIPVYLLKQVIMIVAPIQRYAELLSSDWMGALNSNQSMHVEIILNSAIDLKHILNGQARVANA